MKKIVLLLALIATVMPTLAQNKDIAIEDPIRGDQERPSVMTYYYGQYISLAALQEDGDVHSVSLPTDTGMQIFSFDSQEEVEAAIAERGDQLKTSAYCTLYTNSNLGGSAYNFLYGFDINSLHEVGINDKVSSFACSGGASMIMYKAKNFTGSAYDTLGEAFNLNLHTSGFGDNITAVYFRY